MHDPPTIHTIFEPKTGTWQYIVADPETKEAVIIDPVLDFDPTTTSISTASADQLLALVVANGYKVTFILETHAHADHLTASRYLQQQLTAGQMERPCIGIGKRIADLQSALGARYRIERSELAGVFDRLFDDHECFVVGKLAVEVFHLPGHTPDHVGYSIGENVFTGDSIFNEDVGSARCDFPGGSAQQLYKSIRKLLALPPHYRLYTGHDYPPPERELADRSTKEKPYATVAEHNKANKHARAGVTEEAFVRWREERDATLSEPKLLHYALQVNIRGGRLPSAAEDGLRLFHIPVMVPKHVIA